MAANRVKSLRVVVQTICVFRNAVSLAAPLRAVYPLRLGIHSICELVLCTQTTQIALLPVGRQVVAFFLVKWVPNRARSRASRKALPAVMAVKEVFGQQPVYSLYCLHFSYSSVWQERGSWDYWSQMGIPCVL
jgi:hypothetical protein